MTTTKLFTILILESDPVIALDISMILEEYNFHVNSVCYSTSKAKLILKDSDIDLIIMNVNAQNADERIALRSVFVSIPKLELILLSSLPPMDLKNVSKNLHPIKIIRKPYMHFDLINAVRKSWRNRHIYS